MAYKRMVSEVMISTLKVGVFLTFLAVPTTAQVSASYRCLQSSTQGLFNIEFEFVNPTGLIVDRLVYYQANDNVFFVHEEQNVPSECSITPVASPIATFTLSNMNPNNLRCGGFRSGNTCNWAIGIQEEIPGQNSFLTKEIFKFSCCEGELSTSLEASLRTTPIRIQDVYIRGISIRLDYLNLQTSSGDPPLYFPGKSANLGDLSCLRLSINNGLKTSPGRSNMGRDFYIGVPGDESGAGSSPKLRITAARMATLVQISYYEGQLKSFEIELRYKESVEYTLPSFLAAATNTLDWTTERKGVRVSAMHDDIAVEFSSCTSTSCSRYVVLPTEVLGVLYHLLTPTFNPGTRSLAIITAHTETTITIEATASFVGQVTVNDEVLLAQTYQAGSTVTVPLSQYGTFQLYSTNDLSSTTLSGTAAFGVTGGSSYVANPLELSTQDGTLVQYWPETSASRRFVFVPLPAGIADLLDYYVQKANRASQDFTLTTQLSNAELIGEVTKVPLPITGPPYEVWATNSPVFIFQVISSGATGQPSMVMMPSTEQWSNRCTFVLSPGVTTTVVVVKQKDKTVNMDSTSIATMALAVDVTPRTSGGIPIYEVVTLQMAAVTADTIKDIETAPGNENGRIMCLVYKQVAGKTSSSGPIDLGIPIVSPCIPQKQAEGVLGSRNDNDCDGVNNEEWLNLIDDDLDGLIDEDLANEPASAAIPDITVNSLLMANNPEFLNVGDDQTITVIQDGCNTMTGGPVTSIGTFQENLVLGAQFEDYVFLDTEKFKAFRFKGIDRNFIYFLAELDVTHSEVPITCPPSSRRRRDAPNKSMEVITTFRITTDTTSGQNSTANPIVTFEDCQSDMTFWAITAVLISVALMEAGLLVGVGVANSRARQ